MTTFDDENRKLAEEAEEEYNLQKAKAKEWAEEHRWLVDEDGAC